MTQFTRRLVLGMPLASLAADGGVDSGYPMQSPDVVKEMVTVSHGNFPRVKELVDARPELAKASYDWGFGDWETALGAAAHVGNRQIAEYLMEHGAPPTLFSATMLGQLEVVKAMIAVQPGVQRMPGPHGISLLAHARAGGKAAEPVLRYLESLGDAGGEPPAAITPEELSQLTGDYRFAAGERDRFAVTIARGQLQLQRAGMPARNLVHRGNRVFHPVGARSVRIVFAKDGETLSLTVHDGPVVLAARRG